MGASRTAGANINSVSDRVCTGACPLSLVVSLMADVDMSIAEEQLQGATADEAPVPVEATLELAEMGDHVIATVGVPEPRFESMETGITNLLQGFQVIQKQLSLMKSEMVTQDTLNTAMTKNAQEQHEYTNLQIAALRAELLMNANSPVAVAGSGVHLTQQRPAKRHAPESSEGSTAFDSMSGATDGMNTKRVWFTGFPRKLLSQTLHSWAEDALKPTMKPGTWDSLKVKAYNAKRNFSVEFDTTEQAKNYLEVMRAQRLVWVEPMDNSAHDIRARPDRTLDVRVLTKFLTILWKRIHTALTNNGRWEDQYKLSTTGRGGVLYISDGNQVWEFFRVKLQTTPKPFYTAQELSDSVTVTPVVEDLMDWGIQEDEAENIIVGARQEALAP